MLAVFTVTRLLGRAAVRIGADLKWERSNYGGRQLSASGKRLKNQFRANLNSRLEAAVNRTAIGKERIDSIRGLSMRFVRLQCESHVNSFNDEHGILKLDLADCLRGQPLVRGVNLTRLQRASKSSRQSTSCRCDDVIQRGGVRLQDVRRNFVMLSYGAVDAEDHGLRFDRQIGSPDRPFHAFDANF